MFGPEWTTYEPETISSELDFDFNELLLDKINVIKVLKYDPGLFWNDPIFLLYSIEVINNNVANFDSIPSPTSLELIWATNQVIELQGDVLESPLAFNLVVKEILTNEGYSEVPPELAFTKVVLQPGQTKEDTANKMSAIKVYCNYQQSLGH